ncbi:MAG TPA: hypothetical protein VHV82_00520 [Sporichthyaceae bacterium]|nr:hypothetical protein [Sporichthyaceae bacterium]
MVERFTTVPLNSVPTSLTQARNLAHSVAAAGGCRAADLEDENVHAQPELEPWTFSCDIGEDVYFVTAWNSVTVGQSVVDPSTNDARKCGPNWMVTVAIDPTTSIQAKYSALARFPGSPCLGAAAPTESPSAGAA